MHQELGSIEVFASVLERAFEEFQNHPFGSPLIPEWRRIEVALDGILPELAAAFDNPGAKVLAKSR
jgi:glucosyl-3-phosphoglycerate synthase